MRPSYTASLGAWHEVMNVRDRPAPIRLARPRSLLLSKAAGPQG